MSNGRIIIGWRGEPISVNILSCSSQFLLIEVQPLVGFSFLCTFVYAASTKKDKADLFRSLGVMVMGVTRPWLILGDFNCTAHLNERIGARVRLSEVQVLRNCMMSCDVQDIKFNGRFYTWTNK